VKRLRHSLRVAALVAAVLPAVARPAEPAGPVPWQDPGPLARMFLQLPLDSPATTPSRALRATVDVINSNSTIRASSPSLEVDIHLETAQVTLVARRSVSSRLELQVALPLVVASGGFLDGAIDAVEGALRSRNASRSDLRPGSTHLAVRALAAPPVSGAFLRTPGSVTRQATAGASSPGLVLTSPGAGVGDAWVAAKVLLAEQSGPRPAVALRAALKLPTGQAPYGSGETDVGGSLLLGWTFRSVGVWLALDGALPTGSFPGVPIDTRPYGAAQFATAWEVMGGFTLHAQASAHTSPIGGTGLEELDLPTYYVLLGATVSLAGFVDLRAGAAENVFSPKRGSDFTVMLGVSVSP
jgi:hypothetical protein